MGENRRRRHADNLQGNIHNDEGPPPDKRFCYEWFPNHDVSPWLDVRGQPGREVAYCLICNQRLSNRLHNLIQHGQRNHPYMDHVER